MNFLRAEWRNLLMYNWAVDPKLLQSYVPRGTELDAWQGQTFVSLVAFQFLNTRVLGVRIPFHVNFEEINLRFYVKRKISGEVRRGVVFIKEIVPRACIALVARLLYNEPYAAMPMWHEVDYSLDTFNVSYGLRHKGKSSSMLASGRPQFVELQVDSESEFITEHYWGYCPQKNGKTIEYRVEHPRWKVLIPEGQELKYDTIGMYGNELGGVLAARSPSSVFLAQGSEVSVGFGDTF